MPNGSHKNRYRYRLSYRTIIAENAFNIFFPQIFLSLYFLCDVRTKRHTEKEFISTTLIQFAYEYENETISNIYVHMVFRIHRRKGYGKVLQNQKLLRRAINDKCMR